MDSFVSDQILSNCDKSSSSSVEPKRKRRRTEAQNDAVSINEATSTTTNTTSLKRQCQNAYSNVKRWRTETAQQIYSSKLIQALHHVRRGAGGGGAGRSGRGREVRRTADRVLAVSAKGSTRWSRAILENSLSLRLKQRHKKVKVSAVSCLKKKNTSTVAKKKKLPAVEKRLRVLGRLIPGCRKASSLNLLEEATDYIAALEMQVRVMAAIAEIMATTPPSAEDRLGANVNS